MANAAWFADRLKELREAAGLTQKQLADKAEVGLRAVTYYESGDRIPGWDVVLALAKALGVDCTAFTQPPAEREAAGPGRPTRAAPAPELPPPPPAKPKPKPRPSKRRPRP